jgi:prolyl 4-hydroxylase
VVYRVMLSLLEHASKDIAELKFEQILNYFRELPSTVNGKTIMADSFRISLKSKHIQNHVIRWRRSKEQTKDGEAPIYRKKNSGGAKKSDLGTIRNSGGISSVKSKSLKAKLPMTRKSNHKEIEIENLSPRLIPILGTYKFVIMLHNVLSPGECSELIDRAEQYGFEDATIINAKTKTRHRDCTRCLLDDVALAKDWYERIATALKNTPFETKLKNAPWVENSSGTNPQAIGLNEHLRLLKYKRHQFFQAHYDSPFVRTTPNGKHVCEMTCASVQIYLNQNFKGGSTTFRSGDRYLDVKPRTGSILLFEHNILHEGQAIIQGTKYLLRTDVMYSTQSASTMDSTRPFSGTTFTEQL